MGLTPGGLMRGPDGKFISFGQTKIEKVANSFDWLGGTLPPWLYVQSGVGSVSAPDVSRGFYQVDTAATVGSIARLAVNQLIDSTFVRAVLFEVDTFAIPVDNSPVTITLGINGASSSGGFAIQQYNGSSTSLVTATGNSVLDYNMRSDGEGTARRNIGLLLLPSVKKMAFLEGGRVRGIRSDTGMVDGDLRPGISITAQSAAVHSFRVSQVKLTVWHD